LNGYKSGFKGSEEFHLPNKGVKKNLNNNNNNTNKKHGDNNDVTKASTDKKFKTLPPAESLPRNETIGGYIFVCNNDTMAENLKRQIFGELHLSFFFYYCYNNFFILYIFDLILSYRELGNLLQ
jgi:hypothetical protein